MDSRCKSDKATNFKRMFNVQVQEEMYNKKVSG